MKNILKNKKLLLIFLTFILLLILLSTYIKTTEVELNAIFDPKVKLKEKELLFETDEKIKNDKKEQKQNLTKDKEENLKEKISKKETEIEKIALIKEIKDPFQKELKQNNTAKGSVEKLSELEEQKVTSNQDLIFLERNIIAENIIDQTERRERILQSKIETTKKSPLLDTNGKSKENKSTIKGQSLKSIRLPFQLLGIIKNSNNSSALFLYQGQTLLKKEKEKIDIFKIEKINNQNLILSYQNKERKVHLWEEKNNEN